MARERLETIDPVKCSGRLALQAAPLSCRTSTPFSIRRILALLIAIDYDLIALAKGLRITALMLARVCCRNRF